MFRRLLPKEKNFFDYFEQHTGLSIVAAKSLNEIASNPKDLAGLANKIKDIEHEADAITHKCIDALHRTFITPIDRSDIHRLIRRLDDIIDSIDSTASRMLLYELTEMRLELKQFTEVLVKSTSEIDTAIRNLRNIKKGNETIEKCCKAIYEAETAGDQILRAALARLFREEKDSVLLIKWKEIFERLERATDRCEEVANIIQGIVIEAS